MPEGKNEHNNAQSSAIGYSFKNVHITNLMIDQRKCQKSNQKPKDCHCIDLIFSDKTIDVFFYFQKLNHCFLLTILLFPCFFLSKIGFIQSVQKMQIQIASLPTHLMPVNCNGNTDYQIYCHKYSIKNQ